MTDHDLLAAPQERSAEQWKSIHTLIIFGLQYGDGVTPAQPKSYNDFSGVIYNSNVQYTANETTDDASYNAAVGEGFAIVTADTCTMTVDFYNILDYNPGNDVSPVHTAVIDKCGEASVPLDA
jgi:hypothetical protein